MVNEVLFFVMFLIMVAFASAMTWGVWTHRLSEKWKGTLSVMLGVVGFASLFFNQRAINETTVNMEEKIKNIDVVVKNIENEVAPSLDNAKLDALSASISTLRTLLSEHDKAVRDSFPVQTDSFNVHLNRHLKILQSNTK